MHVEKRSAKKTPHDGSANASKDEKSLAACYISLRDVIIYRETNYELRFMATSSDDIPAFNYLSVISLLIRKSGMMPSQTYRRSVNVSFDAEHGRVAPYARA
jgi:hypothetical protein